MENINFQGIPVIELVDPAMENWVHHVPYVLPQVVRKERFAWSSISQSVAPSYTVRDR